MIFRVDRQRRGTDRWLELKLALFAIGAALALLGFALRREWLVDVAIGVLVVGFLLRLLRRRAPENAPDEADEGAP